MLQFYFLSIFTNLIAGIALTTGFLTTKYPGLAPIREFVNKRGPKFIIGLVSVVIGFSKFTNLSPGETIPIVGDFLPALSGLGMGSILLLEFLLDQDTSESEHKLKKFTKSILLYKTPIGFTGLILGIIHFLVPGFIFL